MQDVKELPVEKFMRKKFPKARTTDKLPKVIKLLFGTDLTLLPVFKGNKFVGEIHEIDLLKLAVDPKEIPEEEIVVLGFGFDMGYFAKTAGDLMRKHEITVSPETKIKDASFIMLKEGIKSVPVMKNKKLIGILTEKDILYKVIKKVIEK